MFYNSTFSLKTRDRLEIIDISKSVHSILSDSEIKHGLVNVWIHHTTAALVVNERDKSLWTDILSTFTHLVPLKFNYHHNLQYHKSSREQNAHAHILNCLIKPEVTIPFRDGRMALGTWQSLLFVELDGPRTRTVEVHVLGEA